MARQDPDLVLVARTDALAVEGLESALERARAYVAAGADVIFVEAPRTREQMEAIPRLPAPCLINMVEGGLTPLLPAEELAQMGYKLAVYANLALRAGARAVQRAFAVLRRAGTSQPVMDEILPWEERQELIGLPQWQEVDVTIADAAQRVLQDMEGGVSAERGRR
jgi:2-methylisocitrate lyase-like PEP mutase family enzyme